MVKISKYTWEAVAKRGLTPIELAMLLNCNWQHAEDLLGGVAIPSARDAAVLKLCANVSQKAFQRIMKELGGDHEWRAIPGFERYEANAAGEVRRCAAGNGSLPGHVLRPKKSSHGHLFVSIDHRSGRMRPMSVHRAVCLAFHGLPPSPEHIVLHGNDVPDDNRAENLRWGTHQENADDRQTNAARGSVFAEKVSKKTEIGMPRARGIKQAVLNGQISPKTAKLISKKAMAYRKATKLAVNQNTARR